MADILKRTTIIVRDAEISKTWYKEVFGFSVWMDTPFTLSGRQLAIGKKGDKTRLIIMKSDHSSIGMIGLLQWLDPITEIDEREKNILKFGAPIFVVSVKDCKKSVDCARGLGSMIYSEPTEWTVTGADGKELNLLGASFFDLDSYFFEVNEVI